MGSPATACKHPRLLSDNSVEFCFDGSVLWTPPLPEKWAPLDSPAFKGVVLACVLSSPLSVTPPSHHPAETLDANVIIRLVVLHVGLLCGTVKDLSTLHHLFSEGRPGRLMESTMGSALFTFVGMNETPYLHEEH